MKKIDLTGQRFERLVVREMVYGGQTRVRCACDCGATVTVIAYNVRNGNTRSCGCLASEQKAERGRMTAPTMGSANRTHGMSKTPTYQSWRDAKLRCFDPGNSRYKWYGAIGVTMCAAWRDSFGAFLADMGPCPAGLTLERKDGAKGYEPGNCEWATRLKQAQNRSWNKATPAIVRTIRQRAAAGASVQSLATAYGMSLSNARLIVDGKTWSNVR